MLIITIMLISDIVSAINTFIPTLAVPTKYK